MTISSQEIYYFFLYLFFNFKYNSKIILRPKLDLTYAISTVNQIVGFLLENIFLLFFIDFKLLVFDINIMKISETVNNQNLLKTCIQTTEHIDFLPDLQPFYYGKNGPFRNKHWI